MFVSLCMIVRDCAAPLAKCLHSVRDLFGEIIVVDTGSRDLTPEVARAAGADVSTYPWQDDFAAARNESLRHARGDYVMWLDADEWVKPQDRQGLQLFLSRLYRTPGVWLMPQVSYTTAGRDGLPLPPQIVWQPRLWPRLPQASWSGRVHEQILPALAAHGHRVRRAGLQIQHSGYTSPELCREKLERNLRLSEMEVCEEPRNGDAWLFLARSLIGAGQFERAEAALLLALAYAGPEDGWTGYARQLLASLNGGGSPCGAR